MKRAWLECVVLLLGLMMAVACGSSTKKAILGKWQEVGGTETMEFLKDGNLIIAEKNVLPGKSKATAMLGAKLGISQAGKYEFLDDGRVKLELSGLLGLAGPVICKVSVSHKELVLTMPDGSVEKYQRIE
jgi:hypothetical protein